MKILHTADLHIGKNVNGFSMIEEQRHVLGQICDVARQQKPDAVLIAGDVYDKSVPSAEAVQLFDEFLTKLTESIASDAHIFIISGNHDSPERIAFGAEIMRQQNIHLSPVYKGDVKPVIISDKDGPVAFYMPHTSTCMTFFPITSRLAAVEGSDVWKCRRISDRMVLAI